MEITVVSDNNATPPYIREHGLALLLRLNGTLLLFDTGAGEALENNFRLTGTEPASLSAVILSHGHCDHSGGLHALPPRPLICGSGADRFRCSRHPDRPVRPNGMRAADRLWTRQTIVRALPAPARIYPGLTVLTPIPRITGEDCGGSFFLDTEGHIPDPVDDECALLTDGGTLIQGCCHAGIGNTLAACAAARPDIPVRAFAGGLHLSGATPRRIADTAERIRNAGIRTLFLMHCTGDNAVGALRKLLPGYDIRTPTAGDTFSCP